jgi:hypothetical protein
VPRSCSSAWRRWTRSGCGTRPSPGTSSTELFTSSTASAGEYSLRPVDPLVELAVSAVRVAPSQATSTPIERACPR